MKFWTSEYTFSHPWEKVTQAAWRKYPNPMNPSVVGIDVIERQVENGILRTHRVIGSQWGIPHWVQNIIGSPNVMYANEKSEVNAKDRVMTLKTRNITFCKFIAFDESLVYEPHPKDPEKTILRQEAIVTVEGVPLSNYIEGVLANTMSTNAGKGRQAMEWVLKKINDELKELSQTVEKNRDEFLSSTKKSFDETISIAKKSIDEWTHIGSSDSTTKKVPPMPDV